jgi:AraC-like DNA-binding protein
MTSAQYVRQRRERLIAAGLCIDCGSRPRLTTAQRCRLCNEKQLERQRMRKVGTAVGRDDGGPTLREIADEVGVSPARVQQIIAKALYKLRRECRRRGIDASWITGKPLSMLASAEERE